jgi:hypothetical protein
MGPRNAYKDMLDKVVSPIACVNMNHQNQLEQMANGAMFDAIHRRCVGSSGAEDPAAKTSLVASTRLSDRPTLPLDQGVGSSGAEDFVLARLYLDSN